MIRNIANMNVSPMNIKNMYDYNNLSTIIPSHLITERIDQPFLPKSMLFEQSPIRDAPCCASCTTLYINYYFYLIPSRILIVLVIYVHIYLS